MTLTAEQRQLHKKLRTESLFEDPKMGGMSEPRMCQQCHRILPGSLFADEITCAECAHPKNKALAVVAEETKKKRKQFARILLKKTTTSSQLDEIVAEMLRLHGGVKEFTKKWYDDMDTYRENHPGSKANVDFHLAFMKVIGESERKQEDVAEIVAEMGDEELMQRVVAMAREYVGGDVIDAEVIEDETDDAETDDAETEPLMDANTRECEEAPCP